MAETTVEKVKIEIGVTSRDAENRIKKLTNELESLKKGADSAGNSKALDNMGRSASSASKQILSLRNKLKDLGKSTLRKSLSFTFAPLRSLGRSVSGVTSQFTNMFNSIKRVALYRAIRTMIKELVQGMREGIQNLYQYSMVAGTQFSKSLDSMATSALYVKNSLATIAEPIVNVVAPIIDMLADKFAAFSAKVAEFLAALFGQATYSRAIKYPTEFAEAAGNAARQLQKWLGPFDEINRLTAASGSGNSNSLDYKNMFETVLVNGEGIVSKWATMIKNAIKSGDFSDVGKALSDKLTQVMTRIDYTGIQKKAEKIAKSITSFLNGSLGNSDNAANIGMGIAKLFNIGITFFSTISSTLKWDKIGAAVGSGLKALLNNFDFKKFIGTVFDFATGIISFLASALDELADADWESIGRQIGQAIKDIDWATIFKSLKVGWKVINAIFDAIGGAIDELLGTKDGTGKFIAEGAAVGILALKFSKLVGAVSPLTSIFQDKNKQLQKQTEYTAADAVEATALGKVFQKVTGFAGSFSGVLGTLAGGLLTAAVLNGALSGSLQNVGSNAQAAKSALEQYNAAAAKAPAPATNPTTATAPKPKLNPSANKTSETLKNLGVAAGVAIAAGFALSGGGGKGVALMDLKDEYGLGLRAGGGFLDSGEAFIARENGLPEYVGRIGGHGAVANNDQIVAGVASGVEEANVPVVNAIYAMANQIVSAIRQNGGGASGIDWNGVVRQISRTQARQSASANI